MFVLYRAMCLLLGYMFGIMQTSFIYGKMNGIDIRQHGSGNAGTTNTLRVLGKKAGLIVFLGDVFKSVLACSVVHIICNCLDVQNTYLFVVYTAFGVILGHNFPFYMQFKGGKGIASTAGISIGLLDWRVILILFVTFVILVVLTKYVSVGSMGVVLGLFTSFTIFTATGSYGFTTSAAKIEACVVIGLIALLGIIRHKANFVRLMNGTENKLFGDKKKEEAKA